MQLFKVIIRALHRFANVNSLTVMQSVIEEGTSFMNKVSDDQYLFVKCVMEWVGCSNKVLEKIKTNN